MALLPDESGADAIAGILSSEERIDISAGTLAEAMIVAGRRGVPEEMAPMLLGGIGIEVAALDVAGADAVASAYAAWGKGVHPAGLNFGDCFAYAAAMANGAPLLFVGDDFPKTDVIHAM